MESRRPMDWYGPEDHDGLEDVAESQARRARAQAAWDSAYKKLPWWRRLLVAFGVVGGAG